MASPRSRRLPIRSLLLAVLVLAALPAPGDPVAAQGPLSCLNCEFELVTLEWNGSALPGESTGGMFEIRNTGESRDRYTITASADNDTWTVQVDPAETDDVPPGSGLFAAEENTARFEVRVLVPEDAPANNKTTITVRVESQNAEDLDAATTTVEARARQVFGWTLDCTPSIAAQKTKSADIGLNATNTGNGFDRAQVSYTPVDGIVVADPRAFEARSGTTDRQTVDVGIGLRADDGTYTIRWDLRSSGDDSARASCTTTFEVVGGETGTNGESEGDNEESPTAFLPMLLVVLAVLAFRRSRSA